MGVANKNTFGWKALKLSRVTSEVRVRSSSLCQKPILLEVSNLIKQKLYQKEYVSSTQTENTYNHPKY